MFWKPHGYWLAGHIFTPIFARFGFDLGVNIYVI